MKTISIIIEFENQVYISDRANFSEEQEKEILKMIKEAIKGDHSYLTINSEGKRIFFPKNILLKSVITLDYGKEKKH